MSEQERIQRRRESALKWYYKNNDDEYLERNREKCLNYQKKQKQPCVYMYKDSKTNKVAYIGSTNYIQKRISNRKREKRNFGKIYNEDPLRFELIILAKYETIEQAREIETKLIKTLKPAYNIRHNS